MVRTRPTNGQTIVRAAIPEKFDFRNRVQVLSGKKGGKDLFLEIPFFRIFRDLR